MPGARIIQMVEQLNSLLAYKHGRQAAGVCSMLSLKRVESIPRLRCNSTRGPSVFHCEGLRSNGRRAKDAGGGAGTDSSCFLKRARLAV